MRKLPPLSRRTALFRLALTTLALPGFLAASTGCEAEPGTSESRPQQRGVAQTKQTVRVWVADAAFDVELATDPASRLQGLSDRPVVPPQGGMLFVFPQAARREFVMRRCLVPIDIAFLDDAGRVVRTHAMRVEPPNTPEHRLTRYPSRYPARYALELAGGTLERLDVREGQRVVLPEGLLELTR